MAPCWRSPQPAWQGPRIPAPCGTTGHPDRREVSALSHEARGDHPWAHAHCVHNHIRGRKPRCARFDANGREEAEGGTAPVEAGLLSTVSRESVPFCCPCLGSSLLQGQFQDNSLQPTQCARLNCPVSVCVYVVNSGTVKKEYIL